MFFLFAAFSIFCHVPEGFEERERGTAWKWCFRREGNSTVAWRLVSHSGAILDLGSCFGQNSSSPLAPTITVDCGGGQSNLWIRGVLREHAGMLECRETLSNGTTQTAECGFNVYSRSDVVKNCGALVHQSNWSADGFCDVEKAFTAKGNYRYRVRWYLETEDFVAYSEPLRRPANYTPIPYNDSLSGKEYFRGKISNSFSLPKYDGNYSLEMTTYPGGGENRTDVLFSVGDTVLAAGDYGVTQLQFPPNEVDRRHDGVEMWCQLDWIIKTNVSVTNSVAYGPDRVAIEHWKTTGQDGARAVVVTCSPTGVNPLSFDMIRWGGRCQGQSGFTCVVSMATLDEGEVEVSCTAVNAANNGHSASMSVRITVAEPDTTTVTKTPTSERPIFSDPINEPVGDDRRAGMMKGVAIGCGVALGVLAAVVAVVLFVLWKRGCFDGDKNKNTSTRPSQHDLNLYEIPEQTPSEEITSRHARAPYTGAIYQNIHT
ncbi:hypothetical protein BaRGS_00006168 [Batillaria attramentaria]|uniref:Ig-like domain-containing protein n=1 Tax=Batillaria attramentaria TaxID=370345 RepID=A0ABD0LTZ1_9CAEN